MLLSLLPEAFTIYRLSPASIANFLELGGSVRYLEFLARLCVSMGAIMYRFSENLTGCARLQVYLSILTIKLKVITMGWAQNHPTRSDNL